MRMPRCCLLAAQPIQCYSGWQAITGARVGMEESLDTGPMFATAEVTITARTTARDLHDTLANLGAALVSALDGIAAGTLGGHPSPMRVLPMRRSWKLKGVSIGPSLQPILNALYEG